MCLDKNKETNSLCYKRAACVSPIVYKRIPTFLLFRTIILKIVQTLKELNMVDSDAPSEADEENDKEKA